MSIPEHIAAYAAGVNHILSTTVQGDALRELTAIHLEVVGMGSFDPLELELAAGRWAIQHVPAFAKAVDYLKSGADKAAS